MKVKSIKYNFLMNLIYNVAMYLFPIITYPYVTRILAPSEIGKVTFAQSFSTYFSIIAICGISTYAMRKVAILRDKPDDLGKFVKEILLLETVLSFFVFVIYVIVIFFFPYLKNRQNELLLMSVNIFTGGISSLWLYNGLEQFESITKRFLICKTFTVVLLYLTVRSSKDYLWYAVFTFLSDALVNLLGLILIPRYVNLKSLHVGNFFCHIKGSIIFLASTIANCIYTNLDSVMLTFLTDDTQTGFYSTALKIRTLLIAVVLALARVLMPRLAYSLRDGKNSEVGNTVQRVMHITILGAVYLTLFTVFFADKIMVIFAGEIYVGAANTLRWTVMSVPVFAVSAVFTEQLYIAQNKEKTVTKIIILGAMADLVLNWILMPVYGSSGGAAATFFTEVIVLVLCLARNGTDNRLYFQSEMFLVMLFLLLTECALLLCSRIIFQFNYLSVFLTGIIYTIVYLFILIIMKDSETYVLINMLIKKFNKLGGKK